MKKERREFFEEMTFDDALFAQNTLEECDRKLNRNKIGIIVSLLVPVLDIITTVICENLGMRDSVFGIWCAFAVAAYLIGGGLKSSLKMVWNVTYHSWLLLPIFPMDLCIGAAGFCMSGAVALFLPIIFVLLTRHQINCDKAAAEQYLACCKPVNGEEAA